MVCFIIDPVKELSPNSSVGHTETEGTIVSDSPLGIGLTSHESLLCDVLYTIVTETSEWYTIHTKKTRNESKTDNTCTP